MLIGVPKEIKTHEYRAGLVPTSARELISRGHQVIIESNAGAGIGMFDEDYEAIGAEIVETADEIFERAEMIVKVKEPLAEERKKMREGQIMFTYFHLAADPELTQELVETGSVCIAYETVTSPSGGLPLLAPMSEVAGRMSVQAGASCLEKERGGRGVLLSGATGVPPADVVIIGGGMVGSNAALIALGLGATVTVVDRAPEAMHRLVERFGTAIRTVFSTKDSIETLVTGADLVIGGVLVPGAAAPKLVTERMVEAMKPGAAIVDVAIDQGGCVETARPTTHDNPTYIEHDVVHYCVTNMPGAVARTSTFALNNVTLPFTLALADKGYRQALTDDPHLRAGLNIHAGAVTHEAVAQDLGYDYVDPGKVLKAA